METHKVLTSAEPLENALLKWRKLYWFTIPLFLIGLLVQSFLAIAILYLIVVYVLNYYATKFTRNNLRNVKFKFVPGVSYDDIFSNLQKELISGYGSNFMVERGGDGGIIISYDGLIYDLILEEDYFRIHWRMSVGKALFSINEYKPYRKILIAMGIIGYELQKLYDIR